MEKEIIDNVSIKDLIKNNVAKFNYYLATVGILIYEIEHNNKNYEFGIPINDLGDATVSIQEKAITLMRYIRKAIESGNLKEVEPRKMVKLDPSKVSLFSSYRKGVMYYSIFKDGNNWIFPIRQEDIPEDKMYWFESIETINDAMNKAISENEFHKIKLVNTE